MTDVSEQQRANLTQLAAYLRTLPADYPDFAMDEYVRSDGPERFIAHLPECGTAACAAGHGPAAGIEPFEGEGWEQYSIRAFCGGNAWSWCFSGEWTGADNTAHGAAARIEWLLKHGIPDDAPEQCSGQAPICYSAALLAAPRAGEGVNRG